MKTVVKKELAFEISEEFNISHNVSLKIVQKFLDQIIGELNSGNRIELRNFGVFEVRTRKSRVARNPRTGEKVQVPEKKTVVFKPGKELSNPGSKSETLAAPVVAPSACNSFTSQN
jgi:integration host factor subunit beta